MHFYHGGDKCNPKQKDHIVVPFGQSIELVKGRILGERYGIKCGAIRNSLVNTWEESLGMIVNMVRTHQNPNFFETPPPPPPPPPPHPLKGFQLGPLGSY